MSAFGGHPLFRFSRRNRPRDGRKIRRRPVFSRSVRRFCGRRTGYAYGPCEPPGSSPTGVARRANEEKPSSPAFAGSVRPVVILRRTAPVVRAGPPPRFPASCTPDRFRTGPKERNPADIKKRCRNRKGQRPANDTAFPPPGTVLRNAPKHGTVSGMRRALFPRVPAGVNRHTKQPYPVPRPQNRIRRAGSPVPVHRSDLSCGACSERHACRTGRPAAFRNRRKHPSPPAGPRTLRCVTGNPTAPAGVPRYAPTRSPNGEPSSARLSSKEAQAGVSPRRSRGRTGTPLAGEKRRGGRIR